MSSNVLKTQSPPKAFVLRTFSAKPPVFVSFLSSPADKTIWGHLMSSQTCLKLSLCNPQRSTCEGWQETAQQSCSEDELLKATQPPQQKPSTPIFPTPQPFSTGKIWSCSFGPTTSHLVVFNCRYQLGAWYTALLIFIILLHTPSLRCWPGQPMASEMAVALRSPPQQPSFSQKTGATTYTLRAAASSSQICRVLPERSPKTSCATTTALVPWPTT
mmetsp:Transcript_39759/g.127388  ORF Transcript_39759/g.127388 Transcript_39759/m.127388 type:complete len:216 (-) Transcript_39759:238-885(-)